LKWLFTTFRDAPSQAAAYFHPYGISDMRCSVVAPLVVALTAALSVDSVAHAALVDFTVTTIGGTPVYVGRTLQDSTELSFDDSILLVSQVGPTDVSGLTPDEDTVVLSPKHIVYGDGTGENLDTAILNGPIKKTWVGADLDVFTETLTTVDSIDRGSLNEITVTLSGSLSDANGVFMDAPAFLMLVATQFDGPGFDTGAMFTNTSTTGGGAVPEASTWAMMAIGFGAVGYAFRRRKVDVGTPSP
jgi:PEP-CTERM motif